MTRNQKNSLLKEAYYNLEQRYYKKISRRLFLTITVIFTATEAGLIFQAAPITAMKVISVIATVFCILAIAWYFASLFVEKQYLKTVGECINDGLCDIEEKETDIVITLDGDIIYTKKNLIEEIKENKGEKY